MTLKQWLQTRITCNDKYTIQDTLNELCKDIFFWIHRTPEIECDYEKDTFRRKFYKFIYQTYYNQLKEDFEPYDEEMYLYFTMKFSQDIIDLFMGFKETTRGHNYNLFHTTKDISLDLEQFLFTHLLVEDPYNDENDDYDYENNIDNGIDESYL